ncbi:MAG TPA: IclR family transcriptional regulator [Conexibacter sp.]|jgi:IclR family acetate operon transcriptional repressor|nr:IclR family transcriptional regulator [Conexibacter sp.]
MVDEPQSDGAVADPTAPRPRVQSAARAIGILLAIAQSENGLTTREISERVQIGRQAVYHLLHTLSATGMVTRDDRNRYLLGFRVGTLAEGFARQLAPSEHLAPIVRALAQETGETSYASGWWSGEIMTLSFARGTSPVQAAEVPQGYVGNAHARASGKLLLAIATPAVREAYLDAHPLKRLTPNTITNRRALEAELDAIRERGYSIDDEEFAEGLYCLAAPFDKGYSPFVLAVSGPRERFLEQRDRYLAALQRVADSAAGTRNLG